MDYLKSHHDLRQLDNVLVTVDKEHGNVHDGDFYKAHLKSPTLAADSGTVSMYFKTPDSAIRIHAYPAFSSELAGCAELRESATVSASGSSLTVFNANRNSSNTSTASVRSSPTLTGSGTRLRHYNIGGGAITNSGGGVADKAGWTLKQGTIYILRFTSIAASNEAIIDISFEAE